MRQSAHEVRRIGNRIDALKRDPLARRAKLLEAHGVSVVLDIGANRGQYGKALRQLGYRGRIMSFEPVLSAFRWLKRAAARDGDWQVDQRALGKRNGTAMIHVSGDSRASSMLEMLPAHRNVGEYFATVHQQRVPLSRLDSVFNEHVTTRDVVFMKLDVQGLEPDVLLGARRCLSRITGIQIELSLQPLYRGEQPMTAMLAKLNRLGFELMSLEYGFTDPESGRMLQVDGVLFRP